MRVVTPGTVIEDNILDDKKNNYLACIFANEKSYAMAWIDVSTGEFNTIQSDYGEFSSIEDTLSTFSPTEIICNEYAYECSKDLSSIRIGRLPKFQKYYDWAFEYNSAYAMLLKQFGITTLAKFEIDDKKFAIRAAVYHLRRQIQYPAPGVQTAPPAPGTARSPGPAGRAAAPGTL